MARLVYIDETGSVGAKIKNQPVLQLVAVIVDEDKVLSLAKEMRAIACKHLDWCPDNFEFHGNELWGGGGHWAGKTPPELLAAYEDTVGLLESLDLWLAHSSIDRAKLHARHDGHVDDNAYRLALQFLLEKLDSLPGNKIIIADESKEEELPAVRMLGQLPELGGGEVPGKTLTSIIDCLHFVQSHASPGVQMADLCAFLMHRCRLHARESHSDVDAARSRMMHVISERVLTYRMMWPS